eukprot:GFYU01033002.1.p1 GENE.GFYU01033002.1~~GFYU01033002.1.p1  ORF type:complete len:317 (-),score=53.85 GFYU01033002.1:67-927(-)
MHSGIHVESYQEKDTQYVTVFPTSEQLWQITPTSRQDMIRVLGDQKRDLQMFMTYTFAHAEKSVPETTGIHTHELILEERQQLIGVLNNTQTQFNVTDFYVPFLRLHSNGKARELSSVFQSITLNLNCYRELDGTCVENRAQWWTVNTLEESRFQLNDESRQLRELFFITVIDRVVLGGTFSTMGIIGLYVTVVFALGRFLRMVTNNLRLYIMYEDLPSVDELMQLCYDIYSARTDGDLLMEEDLYCELIDLLRSPDLLKAKVGPYTHMGDPTRTYKPYNPHKKEN